MKVVFNRYTSEESEILKETEEALKCKAFSVIPNDYVVSSAAINNGTPLVTLAPRSQVTKAYHSMVLSLGHRREEKKAQSANWMGRLRSIMVGRGKASQAQAC